MQHRTSFPRLPRRGLTLVELLVALAVVSLLAGIALPAVKNGLKNQKLSRSASLLKSAIQEGRARSIRQGGGGGIIIDRVGNFNASERSQSTRIRFASATPPYTGDVGVRNALFGWNGGATQNYPADDVLSLWFHVSSAQVLRSAQDLETSPNSPTLINPGDHVSVGKIGLPFEIGLAPWSAVDRPIRRGVSVDPAYDNLAGLIVDPTQWVRVELIRRQDVNQDLSGFLGLTVPFSVTRRIRPSVALPVEMTPGTAIDLTASGMGRYGNEFSPMYIDQNYLNVSDPPFATGVRDYSSIFIIFGARGEVSRVILGSFDAGGVPTLTDLPITGDVHLLVGQAGEVKTLPDEQLEDNDPNPLGDEATNGTTPLLNPESIWVTIKSRSGEVVTSPWTDPTVETVNQVPLIPATTSGLTQQERIRTVIGRVRSAAVNSRDVGSS